MSTRKLHRPPDQQTIRRLTTHLRLNKEMIERTAADLPQEHEQREKDLLRTKLDILCSDAYGMDDPGRLAYDFMRLGDISSELATMRLHGFESFGLLDKAARAKGLKGLIIGFDDHSDAIHVQRWRPYLSTPIRALATLETLLDLWHDKGKAFWACGLSYCVRYLYHASIGDNPDMRLASRRAWDETRHGKYVSAARGLMYLHLADRFEEAIKEGIIIPENALEDSLWFLGKGDRDHIAHNMEYIRNTLLQAGPMHNWETW